MWHGCDPKATAFCTRSDTCANVATPFYFRPRFCPLKLTLWMRLRGFFWWLTIAGSFPERVGAVWVSNPSARTTSQSSGAPVWTRAKPVWCQTSLNRYSQTSHFFTSFLRRDSAHPLCKSNLNLIAHHLDWNICWTIRQSLLIFFFPPSQALCHRAEPEPVMAFTRRPPSSHCPVTIYF